MAKTLEEAGLEAQLIAAVVATGDVRAQRGELLLVELQVEERVEPFHAVVAIHPSLP